MKIIIVGYGKMGQIVEEIALSQGHEIACRVDPVNPKAEAKTLLPELRNGADAAIEFALAEGIDERIAYYLREKLPAVIATTGWHDKLDAIRQKTVSGGGSILHGSNFAIGANIFFAMVRNAVSIINQFPEYDVLGYELHHKRKKDSPSGTALSTAEVILDASTQKNILVTEKLDRAITPGELHFASVRGGYIPGIHTVLLDSEFDTIEITHNARNRTGMAAGAVAAAGWLIGKKGLFHFQDFIKEKLENR
ncbi:MAG: 4-hydroxy-tetrahydrodipicolinate reductase [Spirochaetales bacterium]|nr:4-hydroxy-tetrahydrodipicolinate reductase [Spirochaetales bacterium]